MDFPGGPVVKNLHSYAGGMGLLPDLGRLHMPWGKQTEHHNDWARALEPMPCNKRSHCNEKPMPRS